MRLTPVPIRVIFIGFGAVARCVSIMWNRILPHVVIEHAVIVEPRDVNFEDYLPGIPRKHIKQGLTKANYARVLDKVSADFQSNFMIDLSVNVDSVSLLQWCSENGIRYISTAIEDWANYPTWRGGYKTIAERTDMTKRTLAYKQDVIRALFPRGTVTMLIDHGMNPGMISHFTKDALGRIALGQHKEISKKIRTKPKPARDEMDLASYYAGIAQELGLEVIHCAERDTQEPIVPRGPGEFINTWSCKGYYEEATDPAQVGWGTHERVYPMNSVRLHFETVLPSRGMDTFARSYEPFHGELIGRIVPHGECSTLSTYLTVNSHTRGRRDYAPSMYYVYNSCPASQQSLDEVKLNKYKFLQSWHVLEGREIKSGMDSVGALLMFKDKPSFFAGTMITAEQAMMISPLVNATTIQVACGVLSGIDWVITHPNLGVVWPESVNTDRVFELTKKYLGVITYTTVPFKPQSNKFIDVVMQAGKAV